MKICTSCNTEKPLGSYAFKSKVKGTLQPVCKTCHNEKIRQHYKENTAYYKAKARRREDGFKDSNFQSLMQYLKEHPCRDCGEKDPIVLEFDHLENKRYNISHMMNKYTWESILVEIAKCEVVCRNCHARRTAKQFGWRKALPA